MSDNTSTMSLIGGQNERLESKAARKEDSAQEPPQSTPHEAVKSAAPAVRQNDKETKGTALHPFVRGTMRDKIYGMLIGSAVGDCIGLYTEFMTKKQAEQTYPERFFSLVDPVTPLNMDWHRTRFGTNVWTDDTDQALCILLGFLHNGQPDAKDFASRLHVWVHQGLRALQTRPLGLGATVAAAVEAPDFLDDPVAASYRAWERGEFYGAANGSLMRCHPLGAICVFKSLTETFEIATAYGLVTHPDPRCIVSCCIVVGLIRGLLLGEVRKGDDIDPLINEAIKWTDDWVAERRERLDKADPERQIDPSLDHEELWKHVGGDIVGLADLELDEDGTIGYVYKALGAAIYVLRQAMGSCNLYKYAISENEDRHKYIFEREITDLIMEAGDADTNGAPAGALLGAFLGYRLLPDHWRGGLKYGTFLEERVEGLCQMLGVGDEDGDYDGKKDSATAPDGGNGFLGQKKWKSEDDLGKSLKNLRKASVE